MKKITVLSILIAMIGVVGYQVYQAYQARAENIPDGAPGPGGRGGRGGIMMRAPLVEVTPVIEGQLEDRVLLVGSLRPIADVQVMSKIAGRIERVLVDVGDHVKKGALLAEVEDREILQQIEQGEATLAVSRASIQQREAELANFKRQVQRYRELHEQQLVSRQELDDVVTRQETAEAQLELSKAQYRQSEASLNQLKINLENTRSYAPMNGVVSRRLLHPGALITPNTPILNLVDLSTLRMVIHVVEKDIVRVSRDVAAEISVDAFPGRLFNGRVMRVSPVLDPATRTGEVEIHVSNPQSNLRAEMFARVTLDLGGQRRGLIIPREAIVYRETQSGVFVLQGDTVRFQPVLVGVTQQNQVEVLEGLEPGTVVVSMGASLLKDGDQVRTEGQERPRSKRGS